MTPIEAANAVVDAYAPGNSSEWPDRALEVLDRELRTEDYGVNERSEIIESTRHALPIARALLAADAVVVAARSVIDRVDDAYQDPELLAAIAAYDEAGK